ncbi:hypothetical protein ATANTOWER_008612 [Ataeniobius toweri]|uniref:Uncharacterized protein n=1 Tax=Ataeniobius toweri TaxID=208326 RepID=A0ABU7AHU5_9TELE|nr:hypothetical protein [Ataeniobius toweri]
MIQNHGTHNFSSTILATFSAQTCALQSLNSHKSATIRAADEMGVSASSPERENGAYKDTKSTKLQDSRHCCLEMSPFSLLVHLHPEKNLIAKQGKKQKVETRGAVIVSD